VTKRLRLMPMSRMSDCSNSSLKRHTTSLSLWFCLNREYSAPHWINRNRAQLRLEVMRVIEAYPAMTRREIALKLGVSVAGVNYALKALVERRLEKKAKNFSRSICPSSITSTKSLPAKIGVFICRGWCASSETPRGRLTLIAVSSAPCAIMADNPAELTLKCGARG